jgi:hypothetical protein
MLLSCTGSERVGRSEATGERLEEAKHINRSLSALGDVMAALAQRNTKHVPFRNSKLTQLLQDSLCGQAKAMMFIHIAPEVPACPLSGAPSCDRLTHQPYNDAPSCAQASAWHRKALQRCKGMPLILQYVA